MSGLTYNTTKFPTGLMSPGKPYILWLASWYPTQTVPFNGDFIQRHAYAASAYHNILLVHTIHDPSGIEKVRYQVTDHNALKEIIIFFKDIEPVHHWIHKLQYNLSYYRASKQFISQLFNESALPLFVHVHIPMKMGSIALWINRKWGVPYLVSEHSASYLNNAPDYFFNRNLYYRKMVSHVFQNALAVTNVSVAVANILKKVFNLQHIHIVRNAVDQSIFYVKEKKEVPFRFVHVSTMTYQKNIDGLISVFEGLYKQSAGIELLLVGPMNTEVQQWISRSSAQQAIKFTGELPYAEVAVRMQESNCLVLFSRYENFPCVIIEALCCGLPVVTSDAGGAAEGIDISNGIVVPSENREALSNAMHNIMLRYQQYDRKQIAEDATARYSYPAIGEKISQVYRELKLVKEQ